MTFLLFLLILSVLVLIHEIGHFIVAKRGGILVEEFGIGLPPRIWGKKIGETIYSINALPIGGFVKLYGEDVDEKTADRGQKTEYKGRAFWQKSISRRLGVILAGVAMNFLLAIVVFSVTYFVSGIPVKTGKVMVVGVSEDSPAALANLKVDDQVLAVDNQKISGVDEFIQIAKEKAGQVIQLEVKRDKDNPCQGKSVLGGGIGPGGETGCVGNNLLVAVIPREKPPEGEGPLGVAISEVEMKHYPFWQMPFYGVREGLKESLSWGRMILNSLGEMLAGLIFKGVVPKDVSGPIGIYQATGMVAKSGLMAILEFLGILSVNLAVVNVLPFPALDGGRLLFLAVEAFFGRKIAPKIEAWANNIGMVILLGLLLLVTINDIVRILTNNGILEKIKIAF